MMMLTSPLDPGFWGTLTLSRCHYKQSLTGALILHLLTGVLTDK